MFDMVVERLAEGFTASDWWMLIAFSIVGALVIRRWDQLTPAALTAYTLDSIAPFFGRMFEGIPANFAFQFAFTRLDDNGAAAVLRLALYFGLIAAMFYARRRYGPPPAPPQKKRG
ncbi:hypothetical protein [Woodsholea maritima]|uniref:hypothetical protein n=1 Tax=Woodsholea maritima TaxID=240237 RepID=UPI00037966B6|nr:hypothetical protein [Woodsholea maritima]